MPANEAITPAESDELFTTESINISNRKYPSTMTASPAIPEIIRVGNSVFVLRILGIALKTKYPYTHILGDSL